MKFAQLSVLLGLLSVGMVDAKPVSSCFQQSECLDYTIVEEPPSLCGGDCQIKVCMTLKTDKNGCDKGSGPISHTCLGEASAQGFDPQICDPDYTALNLDANQHGLQDYREEGTQCKTVTAGSVAIFVFKDGGSCPDSGDDAFDDGTASCQKRATGEASCSGVGNEEKECFWRIQTPPCSGGGSPSPPTPSGGSPSPPTPTGAPPSIEIRKTVLLSGQNKAPPTSCNPGKELVQGMSGQSVVYCYEVTNTGGETLTDVKLNDSCLGGFMHNKASLPAGGSFRVPYAHTMTADMSSTGCEGNVEATPASSGGIVTDSDPAGHRIGDTEVDCTKMTTNSIENGRLMVSTEETCTYCACV